MTGAGQGSPSDVGGGDTILSRIAKPRGSVPKDTLRDYSCGKPGVTVLTIHNARLCVKSLGKSFDKASRWLRLSWCLAHLFDCGTI